MFFIYCYKSDKIMINTYYQLYVNGQWQGDYDSWEEAETMINAFYGSDTTEILSVDR